MTASKAVDEYIAAQPEAARDKLEQVRSAIWKALPEAEEVISYGIPGYKLHGRVVLFFAGWKRHYSIYPVTGGLAAALKNDLARCEVEKGTIRFSFEARVPVGLISRIAGFRAGEEKARQKETSRLKKRPKASSQDKTSGSRKNRVAQA